VLSSYQQLNGNGGTVSKGHEYLKRLHQVLTDFEQAVVEREGKGLLDSKIQLQQGVDRARKHLIDEVVKIVTEARTSEAEKSAAK
jgi:hypothetical protein